MPWRNSIKDFGLALKALIAALLLVAVRWGMWEAGLEGLSPSVLFSSMIGGATFILGLVVAGTLSDYNAAQRAPADLASGLYSILRETEQMAQVWQRPNMPRMRDRLIAVVDGLRRDIDHGGSRECQDAIEGLSQSFLELEESDVPANYVVRLRQEQAGLRKSVLRVYQIQREEFLPSAYAMIVSFIVLILGLIMVTKIEGVSETLVSLFIMSFFFVYLLLLLNVINTPFKAGAERGDDDVSLFALYEFVVHARLADADLSGTEVVAIAEQVEAREDTDDTDTPPTDIADVVEQAVQETTEP